MTISLAVTNICIGVEYVGEEGLHIAEAPPPPPCVRIFKFMCLHQCCGIEFVATKLCGAQHSSSVTRVPPPSHLYI